MPRTTNEPTARMERRKESGAASERDGIGGSVGLRPLSVAVDPDEVGVARAPERRADPETTFPQSVASGDPSSAGAILWTRVDPAVYDPDTPLFVEVGEDESFGDGRWLVVAADEFGESDDYTVKIDLDGSAVELASDRTYFYRFEYDGVRSRTGRFRTLPAADASPERVRFAVVTCQNYLNGYFGAHHHIAAEEIDFVLDLGDFIYEYGGDADPATGATYPGRSIDLNGRRMAHTLDDYREIYRTYHEDRFLQESLERHARIHIWDDHEFANDIYWDDDRGAPVAPDHPLGGDRDAMHRLVRDALKAWWEYTPIRIGTFDPAAADPRDVLSVRRSFQFGDLLTLVLTDERLRKTTPTGNCMRNRLPGWLPIPLCYVSRDPNETMLGREQRSWFLEQILRPKRRTTWTAWGNQVLTLPARIGIGPFSAYASHQAWDGYEAEREMLMYQIWNGIHGDGGDDGRGRDGPVSNFVTLTGDMHSYLVGIQRLDYPSVIQHWLTTPGDDEEQSRRVGVELMTPALTSINFAEKFAGLVEERFAVERRSRIARRFGLARRLGTVVARIVARATERLMPHIEYFGSRRWGYSVVEFDRTRCLHWTYEVDKTVDSTSARRELIRAVAVPAGTVAVDDVTEEEREWMARGRSGSGVSPETSEDVHRPVAPPTV
jgi:alkaline phosphatase D